jgi:zinc/manganese transport system permease protein
VNTAGLEPSILGPAFLAGLLVLSTHVPLGREVLARGIIFIDLAIAQIAGLGVMTAHVFGWEAGAWAVQATAIATALAGALVLYACERRWPEVQEAIIGTAFILAASAGILMLSGNPQAGEHLRELLVGQILWVDYAQLPVVAALYGVVLLLWFSRQHGQGPLLFYLLFAVTVTASVQLVGVYLVFASLIIPALAVRHRGAGGLWSAYGLGAAGYAAGLAAAAVFDLPAGAVIVWMLAALALLVRGLAHLAGAAR